MPLHSMPTSNKKSAVLVPLSSTAVGCCVGCAPGAAPHAAGNDLGSAYVTFMSSVSIEPAPWCTNVPRNVLSCTVATSSAGAVHFESHHAGSEHTVGGVVVVGSTVVVVGWQAGSPGGKHNDCANVGGDPMTPTAVITSNVSAALASTARG